MAALYIPIGIVVVALVFSVALIVSKLVGRDRSERTVKQIRFLAVSAVFAAFLLFIAIEALARN